MKSSNIRKLALASLAIAPALIGSKAFALPALPDSTSANLTAISGSVSASVVGSTLTVVPSNRAILQWQEFQVGTGTIVDFSFASAGGAVLNKIKGAATVIAGGIQGNGSVYFINPNGITVSPGAAATDKIVITSGDFGLSTVLEPDASFTNNGKLNFIGSATQGVTVNSGSIIDVNGTGTIYLAGTNVAAHGTYNGNLYIKGINGATVAVDGTVAKNLEVSALDVGYAVTLASSTGLTVTAGDLTVTSGGSVELANNVAGTTVTLGNVTVATTKADAAISSANKLTAVGASKVVTLTGGTTTGGDVTFKGDATTIIVKSGNVVTITDDNAIKLGASTVSDTLNVTATGIDMATTSDKLSVAKTLNYNGGAAGNVTLSLASPGAGKPTVVGSATSGVVSLTSDGDINLGNIGLTADLTVKSAGSITQTGAGVTTGIVATKATFDGAKNIDLSLAGGNTISTVILKGGAGSGDTAPVNGVSLTNKAATLTIGDATAVTGATTITTLANGAVKLGTANTDVLSFSKPLTLALDGAGTLTTVAEKATFDNIAITSVTGNLTLGVSDPTKNQVTVKNVAVTGGSNFTLYTNSAVEFGKVDLGAKKLTVFSKTGSITSTDTITATAAQIEALGGSVTLTKDNAISGTIDLVGGADHGVSGDFTLTNTVNTTVTNAKIGGTASFNVGKNQLAVTGSFSQAKFTAAGGLTQNISIASDKALTLLGSSYTSVAQDATDGTISVSCAAGDLTIGNNTQLLGSKLVSFTSTAGNITQSGGNLWLYSNVNFTAGLAITVNDVANNFGGITALSNGAKDISIKEASGMLRVVAADTALGAVTFANSNGDVKVSGSIGATLVPKTISLNADAGSVNAPGIFVDVTGSVNGSAKKDFITTSTQAVDFNLGTITTTSGKLSVTSAKAIKQATSTHLTISGNAAFNSTGDNIDVQNSGNTFGSLTLTTDATHAASVKQSGNVVLAAATVKDLLVTAESGTITDDTSGSAGADQLVSTGTATFKGTSITIDDDDGKFAKVALIASGDASIRSTDAATDLTLIGGGGASGTAVTGKLTVISARGIKEINGISAGGLAYFEAASGGTGTITLTDSNTFGSLIVKAGGDVNVLENDSMNLAAGSNVSGAATLTSAADISTTGVGASFYNGTLYLSAGGTITLNPIFVKSTLTVNSNSTKDLSSLSKSGNLYGNDPVNVGTGSYKAPQP